jgi:hypothetical protein
MPARTLRIGKLPPTKPVRLTITLPAELHGRLLAYAAAYSESFGETVDPKQLVPSMLDGFMRSDRAFARRGRKAAAEG